MERRGRNTYESTRNPPMISQLLTHLFGDFVLQTDWMALNKSKRTLPCLVHVLIYTSCFLLLTTSRKALLVIGATHFVIDRFPMILRRLIWLKNHFPTMKYPPFRYCDATGYYDDSPYTSDNAEMVKKLGGIRMNTCVGHVYTNWWGRPRHFFITIWLYIVTDNSFHLLCNYLILKYLG